ncbi:hypothetical protein QWY82_11075 [Simiduia curdlanivorans]|uniref:Lipoprotein n=1 Tax=Simiduia curdlanivorans TaxID=1492769 RepID=A0ABV8V8U4_9GAMM|nr:hypothetical protein [Simiduia curdlanivorans]MDN3639346.1 hypothetical protein [Simiduia curdlanivorans]
MLLFARLFALGLLAIALAACSDISGDPAHAFSDFPAVDQRLVYQPNDRLLNREAPIPAQCYTKTEQRYNPCYVCHQAYPKDQYRMNRLDDAALQGTYMFSEVGTKNHWQNLFEDRQDYVAQVSDSAILKYINTDNYSPLKNRLEAQQWQGYLPDLAHYADPQKAFSENGLAKDGSHWVAFNYKPFPSTFWPTNGSTDDVIMRLPPAFYQHEGHDDPSIYWLNLSLVEMSIQSLTAISVPVFNEVHYQIDINGDNKFDTAVEQLVWQSHYFGDASDQAVTPQQYPLGTEFLHSVRYVGVSSTGDIGPSTRFKELRHMKKIRSLDESQIDNRYRRERKEKVDEELPYFVNHHDQGMDNNFGWMLTGFIEDSQGELRPQTHEETMACMGCHSAIGSTIDQTFAFGRKITGKQGWGYINLKGMPDAPSISSNEPEIAEYLRRVGGGDEFRQNQEMQQRWFNADGSLKVEAVAQADVYQLITPSPERALQLNKAYTHLVRTQRFVFGRDASWLPAKNVLKNIDEAIAPLSAEHRVRGWDIRLQWPSSTAPEITQETVAR